LPSGFLTFSSFPSQTALIGGSRITPFSFSSRYVLSRSSQRKTNVTAPKFDLPHLFLSQIQITGSLALKPNSTPS